MAQSWELGWPGEAYPAVPVSVDIRKFDVLWRLTTEYVACAGAADDNQPHEYPRADASLGSGEHTWMPVVGLDCDGLPTVTDGWHRSLWMREHEAWSMPVAVAASDAAALEALCGTRYRTSSYVPPPARIPLSTILAGVGLAAVGFVAAARA